MGFNVVYCTLRGGGKVASHVWDLNHAVFYVGVRFEEDMVFCQRAAEWVQNCPKRFMPC